jgi:hypothetical protein
MAMTFRVELVWQGEGAGGHKPCSIYLTKDGRIVLQGKAVPAEERRQLDLPEDVALVSIDKATIEAIKKML